MTVWMDLDRSPVELPPVHGGTLLQSLREAGELSERLYNGLRFNDAFTIGEALLLDEQSDLMRTPNFGRKSLREWQEFKRFY